MISVDQSNISLSVSLKNGIDEEMRKMIAAGTPIPLFLLIDLEDTEQNTIVTNIKHMNLLQYNPVNYEYSIFNQSGLKKYFTDIDSAIKAFAQFRDVHICSLSIINKESQYVIKIQSLLGTTKIDALGGNDFDLMYYWDYKRPSLKTEPVSGKLFMYRRK
jgi:hypothetical protein